MNGKSLLSSGCAATAAFTAVTLSGFLLLGGRVTPSGAAEAAPKAGFRFGAVSDESLGLWDGDKPVLVYNHGLMNKAGVPAELARSSYVHPLYGLDGEVLTDDFPKDHLHHRGLFWAWPHVKIGDQEYDLWALKGIRHQIVRWIAKQATPKEAVLAMENGWYVGVENVVQEKIWLCVHPATADERAIDVECEWVSVKAAMTLTGAEGKSYGGLTLRFAPGTNTAITIPSGLTKQDLPMTNLPWADLTRLWDAEKKTSGAAIFVHPSHPDFPPQWLTRHYGVLCLGWPGVKPAKFQPGEVIRCRYRICIHRGQVSAERLAQAFDDYKTAPAPPR
jgi:hypothetical protein